ncbi:hypothetical protein PM082_016401 [Marasmius tenuissimus]|nr:hypothetical protein PM082_016401 [Marasmius tenuissimus]
MRPEFPSHSARHMTCAADSKWIAIHRNIHCVFQLPAPDNPSAFDRTTGWDRLYPADQLSSEVPAAATTYNPGYCTVRNNSEPGRPRHNF